MESLGPFVAVSSGITMVLVHFHNVVESLWPFVAVSIGMTMVHGHFHNVVKSLGFSESSTCSGKTMVHRVTFICL